MFCRALSMQKKFDIDIEIVKPKECESSIYINKIIKSNREIFIMSALLKAPMCGYDIIKNIFNKYQIFLNQGTVYPVLYSLEEEGVLYAKYNNGDMRSKEYNFSSQGKEIAQTNITEFIGALNYITKLIQK